MRARPVEAPWAANALAFRANATEPTPIGGGRPHLRGGDRRLRRRRIVVLDDDVRDPHGADDDAEYPDHSYRTPAKAPPGVHRLSHHVDSHDDEDGRVDEDQDHDYDYDDDHDHDHHQDQGLYDLARPLGPGRPRRIGTRLDRS